MPPGPELAGTAWPLGEDPRGWGPPADPKSGPGGGPAGRTEVTICADTECGVAEPSGACLAPRAPSPCPSLLATAAVILGPEARSWVKMQCNPGRALSPRARSGKTTRLPPVLPRLRTSVLCSRVRSTCNRVSCLKEIGFLPLKGCVCGGQTSGTLTPTARWGPRQGQGSHCQVPGT